MAKTQQEILQYDAALEQMKADYLPILDTPITDKKQLAVVKEARMNFRNTRLEGVRRLDEGCKALYANHRLWVAARDGFEEKFSAVEEKFLEKEREFEKREERKFLEQAQAEAARVKARKDRLFEMGFRFDGKKYVLEGFTSLEEEDVSSLGVNDLELGEWLNELQQQVTEHREREEEKERTARIAQDALQKQQEEEAARLLALSQENDRRAAEIAQKEAAMNAKIIESRKNELIAAGMALNDALGDVCEELVLGDMLVEVQHLHLDGEAEFMVLVEQAKDQKLQRDKYLEEQARVAEELRQKNEARIREEARLKGIADEQARVAREAEEIKLLDEAAATAEAERVAGLDDKGKILMVIEGYRQLRVPALTSEAGIALMKRLRDGKALFVKLCEDFIAP